MNNNTIERLRGLTNTVHVTLSLAIHIDLFQLDQVPDSAEYFGVVNMLSIKSTPVYLAPVPSR